ncbi:MAG: hypothetical protein ACFLMY_13670 [Candidatus Brachytrichaceae bacterium NZ_4S206]|jgi:hypothetical protein
MVTDILPLGAKDHSRHGVGLDASDRDGGVRIRPWPVFGLYQPDAIAAYSVAGRTYLGTANEGDARAWGTVEELARVGTLPLEPSVFPDSLCGGRCADDARLGRLLVTTHRGRNAETGRYEALYALGARSFSIWSPDGTLVWDSGDDFERRTAGLQNVPCNASSDNALPDDRSDDRGPEPEGLAFVPAERSPDGRALLVVGFELSGSTVVFALVPE